MLRKTPIPAPTGEHSHLKRSHLSWVGKGGVEGGKYVQNIFYKILRKFKREVVAQN